MNGGGGGRGEKSAITLVERKDRVGKGKTTTRSLNTGKGRISLYTVVILMKRQSRQGEDNHT